MTPDEPSTPDPVESPRPARARKRRRHNEPPSMLRHLWLPATLLAAVAAIFGVRYLSHLKPSGQIAGYISTPETLTQEYLQYEGKPLHDMAAEQQFQQASILAAKGDFRGAILTLESISKQCSEPVVFHDLGVLYAQTNDHERALRAFREALARDSSYGPVRLILNSLHGFTPHEADPVAAESEPNGTYVTANLISLETDVVGEISAADDLDCYRFSAPAAPRDVLRIEVKSQSVSLAPRLTIYDDAGHPTGETAESPDPGAGLSMLISPRPNSTRYVEVAGNRGTMGAYALRITPLRAFDRFEPNDEIAAARPIALGQTVEANIMSTDDTDFYSFMSDRTGKISFTVQSQSGGLVPALTVFGANKQPLEYITNRGEQLTWTLDAQEHEVYYVEVWGQSKSAGTYSLLVK